MSEEMNMGFYEDVNSNPFEEDEDIQQEPAAWANGTSEIPAATGGNPDNSDQEPGKENLPETDQENETTADEPDDSESRKRAEHEAEEAKREAEWKSRKQKKEEAECEQLRLLEQLSVEELIQASIKRAGADTEKLTRRNMKECVTEFIQAGCMEDPDFARLVMQPRKSMIHCFQYINRKAREYAEEEMKNLGIKPSRGEMFVYSSDIPDGLCYQWADEYFRNPMVPEDQEEEEEFVPRPYAGKTSAPKTKGKKVTEKKPAEKKQAEKRQEKKTEVDGQITFGEQISLLDLQTDAQAG